MDAALGFAGQLLLLSMFSIGGANVVLPEVHRYLVLQNHWIGEAEFGALVALSQAAPGPNVLVVAVLGYQLDGLAAAGLAILAFVLPPSLLTFGIARLGGGLLAKPWARVMRQCLGPLTAGLVLANGWILGASSGAGRAALPIAAGAALLSLFTRTSPVWIILAAGAAGALIAS